MATNFPTSLDSLTNPTSTDTLASPSHSGQHADANDAIEALEAKVGVDGSAVTTSHSYKIAGLEGKQYVTLASDSQLSSERVLTAGTGITVTDAGAGSTVTVATSAILPTVVDAKGDLIAGTANDTVARVAVGSNNQVLTADSAETAGVKWATPTTVATDTIWDAKGDLAVATGADAAAKLTVGSTSDHVLVVDSSQTTGLKWQGQQEVIVIPVSDEATAITTGTAKVTFRMPFAMTLTAVRASLTTASTSGLPAFDINESGTSILSTTITIDANELTSTTAATAAVISDTSLADDAQMTIDIDAAGTGAKGAKIYLIGRRT